MGERADRLRDDLQVNALHGPARALADEAVLILGRLETLEAQLAGDPDAFWKIRQRVPDVVEIQVTQPMQEARQQGLALARVLDLLVKLTGKEVEAPAGDFADELARRRQERLAGNG